MTLQISRGRFITLEGGEGAGKSTQAARLEARLRSRGFEVVLTREPGGSPLAEQIRSAILSGSIAPLGPAAEAVMFSAARIDHLLHTIRPALDAGKWVICDRFSDSTRAYQGALGKLDPAFLRELERVAVGPTRPDLTIVIDVPADVGLARARARSATADRFEAEGLAFHEALRTAFLDIAAQEPGRCAVVYGAGDADSVANSVWCVVCDRLIEPATSSLEKKAAP